MKTKIKISIITATWNCSKTLQDCFDSVARQTYSHKEHVIVDGASTDGTIDVIKNNICHIDKFKSESDKGIYDALNKGIQLASGEVVGFLHSDDFYTSDDVLEKIANAFEDPSVCGVYGDLAYVSQTDTSKIVRLWRSKSFVQSDLSRGWMPPHPTLYVRREWYSRIGGFNIEYKIAADYLSILNFFSQENFKTVYVPDLLVTMRLGGSSNRSVKSIIRKSLEDWNALRSCGFSFLNTVYAVLIKNVSKIKQFL